MQSRGVGGVLASPEGDEGPDDDALEADDQEELSATATSVDKLDLLRSEGTFRDGDQCVGHARFAPAVFFFRLIKPQRRGVGLEEGDGLDAGYVEALAAADVFAAEDVVGADHVALGLGEAGAVTVVGAAAELGFFAADEPGELILALLAAVRAGHGVGPGFRPLVEKIALFHTGASGAVRPTHPAARKFAAAAKRDALQLESIAY